jgi:hypothetical protein
MASMNSEWVDHAIAVLRLWTMVTPFTQVFSIFATMSDAKKSYLNEMKYISWGSIPVYAGHHMMKVVS